MWEYHTECEECNGKGELEYQTNGELKVLVCDSCNGSGNSMERTIADIYRVMPLEKDVQSHLPPFGSETLPTEIQSQMVAELLGMESDIFETIWGQGTYVDKERKNTTAFEVSVRSEEKLQRLQKIERNRAKVVERITNLIGGYLMPEIWGGVVVRENTRFVLTTASENYVVYLEAKKEKAPNYQLDNLYREYLEAKYQNDATSLEKHVKLMLANPSPHHEITEVQDILTPVELTIKKNFERYINRFIQENADLASPDISVQDIYTALQDYANAELNIDQENGNPS